jgi:hypothetical protein
MATAKTKARRKNVSAAAPEPRVLSYLVMRKLVGILGVALPIILLIGAAIFRKLPVQSSISAYYYTNMQDALTGILFAVAMFLFCYNGYGRLDTASSNIAAVGAIGVALFPSSLKSLVPAAVLSRRHPAVGVFQLPDNISGVFHVVFASLFFLTIAFIAFFVFTKGGQKARNVLYRVCAVIIVAMLVSIAITEGVKPGSRLVFVFETAALWAFGVSWLVKGEGLELGKKAIDGILAVLKVKPAGAVARAKAKR